jgi:polysaccharide pyruvyl transferase WcaK-like protein
MGFDGSNSQQGPRIALLTPYTGGNLGDAAIQHSLIHNLSERLPAAEFSGITLNCENFTLRHGSGSFPLCANSLQFYGMSYGDVDAPVVSPGGFVIPSRSARPGPFASIKNALKRIPFFGWCLKAIYRVASGAWRELGHCVDGYCFLKKHDLLIVSGGGQLDDEWGGAWGHPYALFKWTALAKIARVPCAFASVGFCKVPSALSRWFLSSALRKARYRSFRERHSLDRSVNLLGASIEDPVVPDMAFAAPPAAREGSPFIRSKAASRQVIAISPICFAKPKNWPQQDQQLYTRYVNQMAQVLLGLIQRGFSPVIVYSSLTDDESVIPDLLQQLDEISPKPASSEVQMPAIKTWQDFVAVTRNVDYLISSRLHSTILGFVAQTPTLAISFDPKVDWVMEDLGMTDFLLQIRDFVAEDVIQTLDRLAIQRDEVQHRVASYNQEVTAASARQFDFIAALASSQFSRRKSVINGRID